MLCLTREPDQVVTFTVAPSPTPTVFTVTYLDRKKAGDRIRLGVDAPQSVHVLRNELGERTPGMEAKAS